MATPPIKLPEPLDRRLTAIAKKRQTTRAPKASELAADLMFNGPVDLSTNPKHMSGYGR